MDFKDFAEHFHHQQLITAQAIKNVFGDYSSVQLSRWKNKGWITQLRKGQFLLTSQLDSVDRELLANEMKNSYISLEYALNYYNLIPEVPQKITLVTTARCETVSTPVGSFAYRQIQPTLFDGYELKESMLPERSVKIASPTKALFDFIYFSNRFKSRADFLDIRLNQGEVRNLFDSQSFLRWVERVRQLARINRLRNFLNFVEQKKC
jgi:predicted transcriptional regulator of viral defense system